jgi:hypothetical protein
MKEAVEADPMFQEVEVLLLKGTAPTRYDEKSFFNNTGPCSSPWPRCRLVCVRPCRGGPPSCQRRRQVDTVPGRNRNNGVSPTAGAVFIARLIWHPRRLVKFCSPAHLTQPRCRTCLAYSASHHRHLRRTSGSSR